MIISISGMPGAGKTTVGTILAKKLGYRFYSIGNLRGEIALKMGITIDELNNIGRDESWTDEKVDKHAEKLGKTEDNFVIDGWIAFHFVPNSLKIFLEVDESVGAERVFNNQRKDEKNASSVKETRDTLKKRLVQTDERYKKYYDVDFLDRGNYNLVIDTSGMTPEEVADRIIAEVGKGSE